MKKAKRILALLLALVMALALVACGGNSNNETPDTNTDNQQEENTDNNENTEPEVKTLVVGYSPFNEKFSPFFSETAYDQDVWAMTAVGLLPTDRQGAVLLNSAKGETVNYNGTDYTYNGIADCVIEEQADGTVTYDFTLRDDIKFSDGESLTVDDVIFSMYVLSDPTYDGNSSFFAVPIVGMDEYRSGMDTLKNLLFKAGRDNADFSFWTEEDQKGFWEKYDAATTGLAQEIVDYCMANYAEAGAVDVASSAALWGFGLAEGAEIADFAAALEKAYGADIAGMINTEAAGSTVDDLFPGLSDYGTAITYGETAANISGIEKTGDNTLRVTLSKVDATAIYQLAITVAPLHYYGDTSKFDYENNKFGFDKGDLSTVRAKTTVPLGAGPYKFNKYENGVVYFEANEYYYDGVPKTKFVNFQQCMSDDDKLNGVVTGTIDITDPSYSSKNAEAIAQANGGSGVTGSVITTNTVDNLGYGYLGISAKAVNVGGDAGSDASKNLRKAFATMFSVYRELTVESYYGDRASVINYPISNTSWAAPQTTDDGYKVAFSVDVEGNDIYTSDMSADDKYAAALEAALGFFEAAGYTVTDGKLTAAPAGASLEYEILIPADGTGDHPSFMMATEASAALETIGMKLIVTDLSDSSVLWDSIEADQADMWCAAWGATPDPDMYQIYYSGVADGAQPGGSNYMYDIADAELDKMILDARASFDTAYRKTMYKACLDTIVDWAVEVPVYQRLNAIIFSTERVNMDTVTPDITTYYGWMSEIQNIELN
ncbi:MAG: ABC transporter substrate-binding protein [Ruminococcaceae bacterium]|jgi:peptide/nickel transport system substrate-binding protein|nr:ABC transporter substrate-binding protein [Oscillospiraceae bacterium]